MIENPKDHENWNGTKNRLIRYYFYCNKGLDTFNNFRYVFMAIAGLYFALHLHQPLWLLVMFIVAIPLLTLIGYYSIHHINKVQDWLNIRFGTHYGLYGYKLQEEIRDGIQQLIKNNKQIVD